MSECMCVCVCECVEVRLALSECVVILGNDVIKIGISPYYIPPHPHHGLEELSTNPLPTTCTTAPF